MWQESITRLKGLTDYDIDFPHFLHGRIILVSCNLSMPLKVQLMILW